MTSEFITIKPGKTYNNIRNKARHPIEVIRHLTDTGELIKTTCYGVGLESIQDMENFTCLDMWNFMAKRLPTGGLIIEQKDYTH
ncbi:MAG: hypothetical protein WC455_10465 [Dehalococcoidia bacterium]|jgi:hypothetical protein